MQSDDDYETELSGKVRILTLLPGTVGVYGGIAGILTVVKTLMLTRSSIGVLNWVQPGTSDQS